MALAPLIAAADLAARLDELVVLDARVGADAYRTRHVRGAIHADLERDLSAPEDPSEGGRHPLPSLEDWAATLGRWGITPASQVAIYDDRGGAIAAARAWWMLRAVGHEAVAVVDGGWAALLAAGVPTDAEAPSPTPAPSYPVDRWRAPIATLETVEERSADQALVDVRAPERYRGEVEPLDPVAGHIPGATNEPYEASLDAEGRFLPPEALRRRWEAALGGRDPKRAILSCGSGVTACHGLLAMEHAGLGGAALYVGSWSEWCRRRPED